MGKSPNGWVEIQDPQHKPLWEAMLKATEVGTETIFLNVGCVAGWARTLVKERGAEVGLANIKTIEINCPFEYNNFETFWYGNASAGSIQGMYR